jgi:UDP-N-acetylmuramyl pentapeptide phosphotransferase/UDP-N-acetylglucosamine-1-phosphate transferase
MPLLLVAAALVLLPLAAGIAAILAPLFMGDTGSLLPAALGAAGLVLAALLVPLTTAGLRAHAAHRASHRFLVPAQDIGADLPAHVL